MRLRIEHETTYRYATPASRVVQNLRLTPRGHDGQFVANWRIDVDRDCLLDATTDPFGNTLHSFAVEGPLDSLTITAGGEVETQDLEGVLHGQVEPLPTGVFLRDTSLTAADQAIRELAATAAAAAEQDQIRFLHGQVEPLPTGVFLRDTSLTAADQAIRELAATAAAAAEHDQIRFLHGLMLAIRHQLRLDPGATYSGATAVEALARGHGVCQDFAHLFCAAARHADIPTRYITGYLHRPDQLEQESAHAWAEALVRDLGWIGFDPVNGICPTDAHVRLAVGLDHLGAAPVRGARYGGSEETLSVRVRVSGVGRVSR